MDIDELLKNWKDWIEVLFPLFVFLGLYILRRLKGYSKTRQLKKIAPLINGELVSRPFSFPRIQGSNMGIPYRITFQGGRGSPGIMQIRIDYPGMFSVNMAPKSRAAGMSSLIWQGQTLETGDTTFNEAVIVSAKKDKEKAAFYLENPLNRQEILQLFQSGFISIQINAKGIVLTKPGDFLGEGTGTADQIVRDLTLAYKLMR
jgi:hypothetical protein